MHKNKFFFCIFSIFSKVWFEKLNEFNGEMINFKKFKKIVMQFIKEFVICAAPEKVFAVHALPDAIERRKDQIVCDLNSRKLAARLKSIACFQLARAFERDCLSLGKS
jgi:hypothetical protein